MRAAVLIYAAAANNSAAETHNPLSDHVKKALNFHLFDLRGNYLWGDRLVWLGSRARRWARERAGVDFANSPLIDYFPFVFGGAKGGIGARGRTSTPPPLTQTHPSDRHQNKPSHQNIPRFNCARKGQKGVVYCGRPRCTLCIGAPQRPILGEEGIRGKGGTSDGVSD